MDFKTATNELFTRIDHAALAKALGVSVALIRQARLDDASKAHRAAPKGWESAVLELANKEVAHYQRLIRSLCETTVAKEAGRL